MPPRSELLLAAVLGTLTVLAGGAVALAVGLAVGVAVDDGTFLSGLLEGIVAGLFVLVVTAPATVAVLRWWVLRHATVALSWGWATLAVAGGLAASVAVLVLAGLLDEALGDAFGVVVVLAAIAVAPLAAYRVLLAWAAIAARRD